MSRNATIVGSGLIGRCWSALFARAGYNVRLYDIQESQLTSAMTAVRGILEEMQQNGLLGDDDIETVFARVTTYTDLGAACADVSHVQECVPEKLDLKRQVFQQLDAVVPSGALLASSTSCIAPSQFTETLTNRANAIVCHPINPPMYCPVVEVVPAPWTSGESIEQAKKTMKELGQAPVVVKKEVNGFIINRLQYALLMEAWRLVEDGVASPEDVDTAVSQGLGLRWSFMGPFETIDLNAPGGVEDYMERYGENITAVCKEQESTRDMKGSPTAKVIHDAMRKTVPEDDLKSGRRREWRDANLAALAVHKRNMAKKLDKQ